MCKLIYTIILLVLPAVAYTAEIESVKIGWDGNYRIGYWCPVRVNLKTDKRYDGELIFKVDNVTYIHPVTIPISSTKTIAFDIVINSEYPEIDIKLSDQDKGFIFQQQLKNIPIDELLVGVEESAYQQKQEDIKMMIQNHKELHLFSFDFRDLPVASYSYESINSVIFHTPFNIDGHNLIGSPVILGCENHIYFHNEFVAYDVLVQNGKQNFVPKVIKQNVYNEFNTSPWHKTIKDRLLNYIYIYALMSIIIALLFIWVKLKQKSYIIFILGLMLCVGISVFLFYIQYLPSGGMMELNVIGTKATWQNEFIMIYNQFSPKGSAVKFSLPYYRPIYRETADKIPLTIRFAPDGGIGIGMPLGARMVFQGP